MIEIVQRLISDFPLELLLDILRLACSTYYYQLKQLKCKDKNQSVKEEILAIYQEHRGNYGYRRIQLELRNRDFLVNHKKVQRLMKDTGLAARIRRKRYYSSYKGEVGRNLIISLNVNLKVLNLMRSVIQM